MTCAKSPLGAAQLLLWQHCVLQIRLAMQSSAIPQCAHARAGQEVCDRREGLQMHQVCMRWQLWCKMNDFRQTTSVPAVHVLSHL